MRALKWCWLSALIFVTGFALFSQPAVTKGGALTDITFTTNNAEKGGNATYTFTFTTETAIPQWGGKVNVQLIGPNGNSASTAWVSNYPNFNSISIGSNTSPSSIYYVYGDSWGKMSFYTNQAIPAGTDITLEVNNVINPSVGGYHFAHIWTTDYWTSLDGSSNWGADYNSPYIEIGSNTNLKGRITDSDGTTPVPFSSVSIYYNSGSNWASYYTYTDKNGDYGFADVQAATYVFYISGPYTYGSNKTYFPPSNTNLTITTGQVTTKNASFLATTKTISGKITKNSINGSAVTNASVNIYKQEGSGWASTNVNSQGEYSFQVTSGTWQISISPTNWPADWSYSWSEKDRVTFADNNSTETSTYNFVVDAVNSTVRGRVIKSDGSALGSAWSTSINFSNTKNQYFYANVGQDGSFETKVSAGTYKVSGWTNESGYSMPRLENFSIGNDETLSLGNITLQAKTDVISGRIIDNTGSGVPSVSVYGWKDDPYDWSNATTASDGSYSLSVVPGSWRVSAWPNWNSGYIYSGDSKNATVVSGVTSTVNFTFQKCTATINGQVTDPDGSLISTLSSWVSASDGSREWGNVGASITNGTFTLQVPAGTWDISAYIYGSDYGSPDPVQVTVGDYQTKSVTLQAVKNDAVLRGTVYDDQGNKVTGKWMSIYGTKGKYGTWMSANLNQDDATYSMNLSAGRWKIGWWIDRALGFSSGTGEDIEVDIAAASTVTQDIVLRKADSKISGRVTKSDGSPMSWAWLTADTRDPNEKTTAGNTYYSNGTSSNQNGDYEMNLPAGTYWVGGSMWTGSGYINPKRQKVTVDANNPATVNLVFRVADATISGTVRNGGATQAYVTSWSEDGGYSEANSNNEGVYSLNVSKGTKWHLKAMKELEKKVYKSEEYIVDMTDIDSATQAIQLVEQTFTLPDPLTITFDPTKQQTINYGDGAVINIPANVVATSGQVTMTITPTATVAEQADAKPYRYALDIKITDQNGQSISSFNGNITIQLPFEVSDFGDYKIVSGEEFIAAWYDESTDSWQNLICTVNLETNTVTFQTNHLTKFALVTASDTTPPSPPTNPSATAGNAKNVIAWTNPIDTDLAGIKIYRSTTLGSLGDLVTTISNKTTTSYDDTSVTAGTLYYYTVRSYDQSGNISINSNQVSTTAALQLPETGNELLPFDWLATWLMGA